MRKLFTTLPLLSALIISAAWSTFDHTASAAMTDGQTADTMKDDDLILAVDDASILANNNATIIEADLVATNGVVHVIDQVLFLEQSLEDIAAATFAAYPNPVQNELWLASKPGQTLLVHDDNGHVICLVR